MSAGVHAESLERDWLRRAVVVLRRPSEVFDALRDDSDDAADARQEPVLALVLLAGAAAVLASPVARSLLDDPARDGLIVAVWAFIGGIVYGFAAYWAGGALLLWALRRLGSDRSYRSARHLVAFAGAPLALSLVTLWPLAVAAFGGGPFRSGGSGHAVVAVGAAAFAAWALALLALGIRVVNGWTWVRALAAWALVVAPGAVVVALGYV